MLTGVALGTLSLPSSASKRRCVVQLGVFAALTNIPDIPLPCWGHARYEISHSIFVNLLLCGLAFAALLWSRGVNHGRVNWRVAGLGIAAWFSHLLLDTFYNHGTGVGILWPLSTATLALPIPWFSVFPLPLWPLTAKRIDIGLIEFVSYAPLVLITIGIRNREVLWQPRKFRYRYLQKA
jgi:hypothetical protein